MKFFSLFAPVGSLFYGCSKDNNFEAVELLVNPDSFDFGTIGMPGDPKILKIVLTGSDDDAITWMGYSDIDWLQLIESSGSIDENYDTVLITSNTLMQNSGSNEVTLI